MNEVQAFIPDKLQCLFEPHRYKIAYGGRGGAKSWAFADALLIQGAQEPLRILCAREIQKSMKESVHQLLRDRIEALELEAFYEVLNDEVRGQNGTLILFAGLRHNVDNIKSKEGLDRVWVEEAQHVSKHSWETLIPTIRKDGSEIWVSFNPELDTDETYRRFVLNPPPTAVVVKVNYTDNPWFPPVLRDEMEHMKATDPDAYNTVWAGNTRQWLDGAIYANEIRKAMAETRITRVPYDSTKPVHTAWDLGESDMTAIWFFQRVGFQWNIIDYYENSGHKLAHYLKELQARPYVYGTDWMPHDADHETVGSPKSIKRQALEVGRKVIIVPKLSVVSGINAARTVFDNCWFDEVKCADGLNCLRHYQYGYDPDTKQRTKSPLHNWASHGADAWRYFSVACNEREGQSKPAQKAWLAMPSGSTSWMG